MPQVGRWLNKDPINELGNVVLRLAGSPFGAETVPQYNWHAHKGISTIWRTKICQTSPARRYPRKKLYSAFPRKAWGQGDFSMTPPTCGYTHAYNRSVDINPYGYVWNDPVNRSDSNGLAPIGSDGNIAPGHFNETGSWIPEPQSQIPQPPQPPEFDALDATELSLMAILPEVMIPIMIGTSCVRNTCGKFAVQAAGNLRRLGLKCINLAGKSYNSGRKALEKRGFVLNRTTKTGRKIFVHPEKGTIITYDSGKALGAGQKPHWTIQDRGGQYYNRCGRPVSGPNPPMGGKHIPGSD